MVTIRHAAMADIPAMVDLLREHGWSGTGYTKLPLDVVRTEAALGALVVDPGACVLLAQTDGEVLGVLAAMKTPALWFDGDQVGNLVFYVAPHGRGAGVGLLRRLVSWAYGFDSVRLITLGVSSGGAQAVRAGAFFRRMGFASVGGNYEMVR
jgi:GNAT superfamily N-acetyltransferase